MYTKVIQVNHNVIDLIPLDINGLTESRVHNAVFGTPQQNYHVEKNGPPVAIELMEYTDISHIAIPGIQIIKKLSSGGAGTVYLVENSNPGINRQEAIKVLKNGDIRRFEFESKLTSALKAKCGDVVEIYGYQKVGDMYFIRMNYFKNGDLVTFLQNEQISQLKVLDMVIQLANAVKELHDLGYVHRDIKPQNLFVSDHHNLRVGDLGGAIERGTEVTKHKDIFSTRRQIDEVIGSPGWSAPEQIVEGKGYIDKHTDVFAIGCVLYYMLKGDTPYPLMTRNPMQAMLDHVEKIKYLDRVDFTGLNPDIVKILKSCLQYNPAERYQDVDSFIHDLKVIRKIYGLREDSSVISKIATNVTRKVLSDRQKMIMSALKAAGVDQMTVDFVEHSLFVEEHSISEMVNSTIDKYRLASVNHKDQRRNPQ